MKYKLAVVVLAMLTVATLRPLPAAPQPSDARIAWEIDIDYKPPQPIMVKIPGRSKPQLFWYIPYTVTNRSGKDRLFVPEIVLYTNTGQVLRAGEGVNTVVYQTIKRLHNNPLLYDMVGITGKLLQGEDNARDGVAIFRDFDPKGASFEIFFGGLSGEIALTRLPRPIMVKEIGPGGKQIMVEKDTITLVKTLKLKYTLGTEARDRPNAKVRLLRKGWVMR